MCWYRMVPPRPTSGQIECVALSDEQQEQQPTADGEMVRFYAGAGYWYDTFAVLEGMITSNPDDAALKSQR